MLTRRSRELLKRVYELNGKLMTIQVSDHKLAARMVKYGYVMVDYDVTLRGSPQVLKITEAGLAALQSY